jgi:hypothetical protein
MRSDRCIPDIYISNFPEEALKDSVAEEKRLHFLALDFLK